MKPLVKKQGLTLIELMVAMLAVAILALTVGLLLTIPVISLRTNNEYARLRRDMTYAEQLIARDVRKSAYSENIDASENRLFLPASTSLPLISPDDVEYRGDTDAGTLLRFVNGVSDGVVVTEGLRRFQSVAVNDPASGLKGVSMHLELESRDGDIAVVHDTFIHTRNLE